MSLQITARSGLPCNHCSDAYLAHAGANCVVVVEQNGIASAFCQSHAEQFMGAIKLYRILQGSGLDATAQQLRDAGIGAAEAAQDKDDPLWKEQAFAAIEQVARKKRTVHVDDVLKVFTLSPHHPSAWGSVWQRARRAGLIERSGETKPIKHPDHPQKHHRETPVWRSRVYQEQRSA